jgi:hypothetical protein
MFDMRQARLALDEWIDANAFIIAVVYTNSFSIEDHSLEELGLFTDQDKGSDTIQTEKSQHELMHLQ